MKLSDVIKKVSPVETRGNLDMEITGVATDSRKVAPGNLFVAVKGTQTDGHAYISMALEKGAAAVMICEQPSTPLPEEVAVIRVDDTEDAVGKVATQFCGDPTERLKLVGVTGTNGKTTIATLLYRLFTALGH